MNDSVKGKVKEEIEDDSSEYRKFFLKQQNDINNNNKQEKKLKPKIDKKNAKFDGSIAQATTIQDQQDSKVKLDTLYGQYKDILENNIKSHQRSGLSVASWVPVLKKFEVTSKKGKLIDSLGHNQGPKYYLHVEEALFLQDLASIELYVNNAPISIQETYKLLEICQIPIYKMTAFTFLKKLGYNLIRYDRNKKYKTTTPPTTIIGNNSNHHYKNKYNKPNIASDSNKIKYTGNEYTEQEALEIMTRIKFTVNDTSTTSTNITSSNNEFKSRSYFLENPLDSYSISILISKKSDFPDYIKPLIYSKVDSKQQQQQTNNNILKSRSENYFKNSKLSNNYKLKESKTTLSNNNNNNNNNKNNKSSSSTTICKYFVAGNCRSDKNCKFSHDISITTTATTITTTATTITTTTTTETESKKDDKIIDDVQPLSVLPEDIFQNTTFNSIMRKTKIIETKSIVNSVIEPIDYSILREFQIDYDVYKPTSSFKKSSPGIPDFRVCIRNFHDSPPTMNQIAILSKISVDSPIQFCIVNQKDLNFVEFKENLNILPN